ncbi:PHD finger protein 20-like protein 1, partial [Eumeta japonica]
MSSNKKPFEDVVKDANNDSMMKDTVSKKNTDEENSASAVSNQKKDFDMKIEERSTNSDDIDHRVLYGNDMAKPSTSSCFMDITMTDSQANDKLQRKQEWKTDQNVLLIDGKGDTESNNSLALSVGSRVEAKDFEEMWYPAHIVELDYDEMEVLVHYDNSSKKYDEWINVSSPRLRPWTSITESLTKEQVHKERDSEQVTKEKDGQQPKRDTDIEKIKQQKDEIEEKTEDKLILRFKVGERCLARWKDNRRFLATVVKDLGNGKYEIIFDDGFPWTCSVSRLVKVKPHTDVSNVSSSPFDKSEPSPNLSNLNVSSGGECIPTSSPAPNVPAASVPYHKHLFDPTRDYLGPKSERREMKRKLNIKDLFNIGTTKRRRTKVVDQTRKKQLELKEMLERKKKRKARRRGPVKNTAQNDVNKKIDLIKVEQGEETVSENTLTDAASTTSDTSSKIATDTSSKIDILPIKKEESSKATKRKENKNEDNLLVMPDVCMKMNLPKKDDTLIDTENKLLQEVKSEDVQSALITLEDIKNVDVKKGKDDIEKGIVKLKDTFEEKEENKVDIKKEDKMKENASCEGNDKILSSKNWKLKRSRLKKARKLRLLCENRVKKEVEEVKNQLVEMKRQVEEMKKQVRMKSVEALSENNKQEVSESKEQPEVNEVPNTKKQPEPRQLLPGEWCCKWVNGHPQGIVSEVGCDVKVVGSSKAVLPRRSVQGFPNCASRRPGCRDIVPGMSHVDATESSEPQGTLVSAVRILTDILRLVLKLVEDDRLPSGWTKHLVRRSFGSSAGQWNVVLVSPENKRFHTKAEVKTYIQVKKDESLKEYERGLFDFGTHRRLSRKIGWDVITCKLPAVPLPSKTVSASSPIVSKKTIVKHRGRGRRDKLESQNKIKKSLEKKSKMFINQSTSKRAVNAISKLEVEKLPSGLTSSNKVVNEDGCVYVGSLKVQIIDNLLRCPAEGCFKNFRNTTLLQMHIKHYHRDLRKSMGVTPKVLDLAYARTLPMETDKSKLKPEAEHKTPKPRMSKPKKPEHEPNIESKDFKEETTVE